MLLIRERAPLRLSVNLETPDGHRQRLAADEPRSENVLTGFVCSSTVPGGHEQASWTLQRQPERHYPDLAEFTHVTARGVGGTVAFEGRLEQTPRTSGDQLAINPMAVGYQAALDDDSSAREIYVDADQSAWQPASVQRKINLMTASIDVDDPTSTPDQSTGAPSVATGMTGPWAREHVGEAWYDGGSVPIGALYHAWKLGPSVDSTNTGWSWAAVLSDDDIATTIDTTGSLRAAGPGTGSLAATTATRKWALLQLQFNAAGGTDGVTYPVYWQTAVVGTHGLPLYAGTGAFPTAPGVLASDVVAHAVAKWCPELDFTTGSDGTIRPSTFVIPHLAFKDLGTASAIVKQAAGYELPDWAVWGRTLYFAPRGTFGRNWRTRVGPSQLQESGPQVDRIWNGALVQWQDVSGITRTAGPPGSRCDIEDASLLDTDPSNPANGTGERRWSPPIQLGTNTAAGALKTGAVFLQEQKLLSTAGQATLTGHVEDSAGVLWPAWMVRAGDTLSVIDAAETWPRRIVRAEYSHDSRQASITLDQPGDALQALLSRLSATIAPLGF